MAGNNIFKTIRDAEIDARSLSEFIYKPASFMVSRRLSQPVHTLDYYLHKLDGIEQKVQDAINNTAVEGGVLADTFVTVTANGMGSVARTQRDKNSDNVSLFDFGVVGDGVTNDTESLRKYHSYCNDKSIKAIYEGVSELLVDGNAEIIINTDVDFNGVPIRIANADLGNSGGWENPANKVFIVEDVLCPKEERLSVNLGTYSDENTMFSLQGIVSGEGCASVVFKNSLLPPRYSGEELLKYQQTFQFLDSGVCTTPASTTLDISDVDVFYRRNSERGTIVLANPCLIQDNKFDVLTLIQVRRNQVSITGFNIITEQPVTGVNSSSLISTSLCSEFKFSGFTGTGITGGSSAYILNLDTTANAEISDISCISGWGWIGSNHINGVRFSKCFVNRIDVHAGGHNVIVEDSVLYKGSVQAGWAGGDLRISNCTVYEAYVYTGRSDYAQGSGWRSVVIHNIKAVNPLGILFLPKTPTYTSADAPTLVAMYTIGSLDINNIEIINPYYGADSGIKTVQVCRLDRDGLAFRTPPKRVSIRNVFSYDKVFLNIDVAIFVFFHSAAQISEYSQNENWNCTVTVEDISALFLTVSFGASSWSDRKYAHKVNINRVTCPAGLHITSPSHLHELNINDCDKLATLNIPSQPVKKINSVTGIEYLHTTKLIMTNSEVAVSETGPYIDFALKKSSTVSSDDHYAIYLNNTFRGNLGVGNAIKRMQGNNLINGATLANDFKVDGVTLTHIEKASYAFYGYADNTAVKPLHKIDAL